MCVEVAAKPLLRRHSFASSRACQRSRCDGVSGVSLRRLAGQFQDLFFYRLLRDQCELAQVVIIERALSVGGLIQSECSGDFDFERTGVDKAVDLV